MTAPDWSWSCFGCGETGHLKAQCPHPRQQSHPPAPPPSSAPVTRPDSAPVPPRAAGCEAARLRITAHGWAAAIRRDMGPRIDRAARLRQLALEQVSEARAARPDHAWCDSQ